MVSEIYIPKMSDHMEDGTIVKWLVKEGEQVTRGQVILEIETDKAVGEIEAPQDGVLKGVRAGEGDTVAVGVTIAYIARHDEGVPLQPSLKDQQPAVAHQQTEQATPDEAQASTAESNRDGKIRATPVARRVAEELGVDLDKVKGSGPLGRIKEEDVRVYAQRAAQQLEQPIPGPTSPVPQAAVAAAQPAPASASSVEQKSDQTVKLTQIQTITGQRMVESVREAPQFHLQVMVNMTEALRVVGRTNQRIETETGSRLSVTGLLVKVVAVAISKHPRVNASFNQGSLNMHSNINLGVAVGTEGGLAVPVIKQADQKSLRDIAVLLKGFQTKASEMRFSPEDLSGSTFTISNLGMYGVDVFTAIINPPESSILAVGRIANTPVGMDDGSISLQPMMSLNLSVDHRVLDGLQAAKFMAEIKNLLEEPYLML